MIYLILNVMREIKILIPKHNTNVKIFNNPKLMSKVKENSLLLIFRILKAIKPQNLRISLKVKVFTIQMNRSNL
jgi:hypothetical protein